MKKILCIYLSFFTVFAFGQQKKISKSNIKKVVPVNKSVVKSKDNTPLVWVTDLLKADSISKKTKKPIFGFFTGSDWCGWCHKLQKDVFAKPAFINWANEKVVLLELDFPKRKQLPIELQQQNVQLAQAFQVQGYPTVWMFTLDKDSANSKNVKLNAMGSLGYPSGAVLGKEEVNFLETADGILNKKNSQ
jgi:protein disulfide-isomerase